MMRKLKKLWYKLTKRTDKTDSTFQSYWINGVHFRVIQDFGTTAYKRSIAFSYACKNLDYGLVKQDLIHGLEMILEANEGKKSNDIASLSNYMLTNLQGFTPSSVLFEVANCFVLLDGEDEKELSPEYSLKKKQLCERSEEIEIFFLTCALNILKAMNYLSKDIEIEDYSRVTPQRESEKLFLNAIPRKNYKKS